MNLAATINIDTEQLFSYNFDFSVKYLMKTDDDAFINVPNMIHVLLGGTIPVYKSAVPYYDEKSIFATRENNRLTNKSNLMLGSKYCNKGRITNPWSKWFVPDYMFSPYEYPEYFSGIGKKKCFLLPNLFKQ